MTASAKSRRKKNGPAPPKAAQGKAGNGNGSPPKASQGNGGDVRTFSPVKREAYLQLLRDGSRRGKAARSLGLDPGTPRDYAKRHPEWAEQRDLAELEAHEVIEDSLFQAASSGNVTACIFYLINRCPDRWRDVRHVEHAGGETPISFTLGATNDAEKRAAAEAALAAARKALEKTSHGA